MPFGLFLKREVITSTRRGSVFTERRQAACLAAMLIGGCFAFWKWRGWERHSVAGASAFGFAMFSVLVLIEAALVLGIVPTVAAPAIAAERDKKTLDSLLATRVSSSDVILGALAGAMLRYLNRLAALVPIVVLIMYLGGIDPRLVGLTFAGLVSTALVTGALAVAVSAGARSARQAVTVTVALAVVLMYLPLLAVVLLPRIWPAITPWTTPIAVRMLDGSPLGVISSLMGVIPRGPLVPSVLKMIAIQAVESALFIGWAILRLRPASRAIYDLDGRDAILKKLRGRWRPRPPCGDNPVLWREMYWRPVLGPVGFVIDRLSNAAWIAMLAYGIGLFALPAFAEVRSLGYGPSPSDSGFPDLNPMARMLVAKVSSLPMPVAPGQSRLDFNIVLRQVTGALSFIYFLMVAGAAAESVVNERERDTWLGLIATPLTGWEVIRGKMLGVIWKTRGLGLACLLIWIIGVLSGALHPLGFLATVVAVGASCMFFAALGVSMSLWSVDRGQATGRVIGPLTLSFTLGALPFISMLGVVSFVAMAGSPPFQVWAALLSYDDVRDLIQGNVSEPFARIGVRGATIGRWFLAALLASALAQAVAAVWLMRAASRGFDASVGRPVRGRSGAPRDCP